MIKTYKNIQELKDLYLELMILYKKTNFRLKIKIRKVGIFIKI